MMKERGIKPEWEVFSPTHLLQDVTDYIDAGLDEPPYFINFVLSANRGFQGAMPYTPKIRTQMVDMMPKDAIFNVSAIGPSQLNAGVQSILMGGHVRVGLEDNLYFSRGKLRTNIEQVERIVRIIRDLVPETASTCGSPPNDRSATQENRRGGLDCGATFFEDMPAVMSTCPNDESEKVVRSPSKLGRRLRAGSILRLLAAHDLLP